MNKIAPYAKAIIGALVAGLASAQQALDDGVISSAEGVGIASATLAALALVWAIPNRDPEAEHQDESVQPPAEQRILGKALAGDLPPTTEKPGGMRARPEDGDPNR